MESPNNTLRVSICQTDVVWENKTANLIHVNNKIASLQGKSDIIVLPEMFTTGFSMESERLAENPNGQTIMFLQTLSNKYNIAIVGSIIVKEDGKHFNRGFFLIPHEPPQYYDKRHLFRMGEESKHFDAGDKRLIVHYKGWNIALMICYDLRFPVWCRNIDNEYDAMIVVASWPEPRRKVWNSLLTARAIENMSYMVGVNRVGEDGLGLEYAGDSRVVDARGEVIAECKPFAEEMKTIELKKQSLDVLRKRFPVWKDADHFTMKG